MSFFRQLEKFEDGSRFEVFELAQASQKYSLFCFAHLPLTFLPWTGCFTGLQGGRNGCQLPEMRKFPQRDLI